MKLGPSKLNPARSIYYIMTYCEVLDSSFFDTIFCLYETAVMSPWKGNNDFNCFK